MPELAQPVRYGINPPIFNPQPGPVNPRLLPERPVDTRKASKAALFSAIAQAISDLPKTLLESYQQGRKARTGLQVRRDYEASDKGPLSGFTATSAGDIKFDPVDQELRKAQLDAYGRRGATQGQTLFNDLSTQFHGPLSAIGAPPATNTGVGGKITDYGQPNDPLGDTNSVVKQIGAWDNKLEPGVSLAVSPDVRAQFEASGISPKDPVRLKLSDGRTIEARWDDVTANDEQAAKLGLKPLRGRFDIFHPAGPHPLRDAAVVGFEPVGVPPAQRAAIGGAATQAGLALSNIDQSGLTAANAPGPVPVAKLPAGPLADMPVRRPTIGRDPQTGAMIYAPTPTDVTAVFPSGSSINISPPAVSSKAVGGKVYPSLEAIRAEGFDPEGAEIVDGGYLLKEVKLLGADERGRGKITDTQKNKLGGALAMTKDFTDLSELHRKLYEQGKAGVQIGTGIEMLKKFIGKGSEDFVTASGKLDISKFKITRALNGAGVLTDRDFVRAQAAAPTLREDPEQFNAKLGVVKSYLAQDLENWIAVNKEQATENQLNVAKEALDALTGKVATAVTEPGGVAGLNEAMAAPVSAPDAGVSTRDNPVTVDSPEAYAALPKGSWYRDSAGKLARKP